MNNHLLKAVIALVLFYGSAAFLWMMLLPPDDLIGLLNGLPEMFKPEKIPEKGSLNFLQLEGPQISFLMSWSLPILKIWLACIAVGVLVTGAAILLFLRNRKLRSRSSGNWRSLSVTLGPLPTPPQLPRKTMSVKIKDLKLSGDERQLLEEILGTLAAHPDAYVGPGHGSITLYQHTLGVIEKVMEFPNYSSEHVLAAAAHDMGKITSFVKGPEGTWERVKLHAQESSRLLSALPAWGRLPVELREVVRLAVKNEHSPNMIPGVDSSVPQKDLDPLIARVIGNQFRHPLYDNPEFRRRIVRLVDVLREADGVQTASEKQVVLDEIEDLPTFCLNAFLKMLPEMNFYYKGVPANYAGMVWQQGSRMYISEAKMRDFVMGRALTEEHHAALGGTYRGPKTLAPFTWYLLQGFKAKGWLVTSSKCYTRFHNKKEQDAGAEPVLPTIQQCSDDLPLWDVLSGNLVLNGMIIIEVDDEAVQAKTPRRELPFPIGAHRPHQPGAGKPKKQPANAPKLVTTEQIEARTGAPEPAQAAPQPKPEGVSPEVGQNAAVGASVEAETVGEVVADPMAPPSIQDLLDQEAHELAIAAASLKDEAGSEATAERESSPDTTPIPTPAPALPPPTSTTSNQAEQPSRQKANEQQAGQQKPKQHQPQQQSHKPKPKDGGNRHAPSPEAAEDDYTSSMFK